MKTNKANKIITQFSIGLDGSHCGLTDWYPENEKALQKALTAWIKTGGKAGFDTGWYSSKKEIASARIYTNMNSPCPGIYVEVSVSDDFDTVGRAGAYCPDATLDGIRKTVSEVWDDAENNRKENQSFVGYSLIHWTREIPGYLRSENVFPHYGPERKRFRSKQPRCLDYYIVPADGDWDSPPTGDNYTHWGWTNDYNEEDEDQSGYTCREEGIPPETVAKLEEFARNLGTGSLRIGDWEMKRWED